MAEDNSNGLTRRRHAFVQPLDTNGDDDDGDGSDRITSAIASK